MQPFERHVAVVAERRAARRATIAALAPAPAPDLTVSCHARLGGPYAGVATVLETLVPDAHARWPELVRERRIELLMAVPELERVIGARPGTLVETTPHDERTRYFGQHLIGAASQGIVTFLIAHARRLAPDRVSPLTLAFDDVHAADPTAQDLVALLLRRADPAVLRVLVATTGADPGGLLGAALAAHAAHVDGLAGLAGAAPATGLRSPAQLLAAYVAADGTSDDPAECDAYAAAPAAARAAAHDARAEALERRATLGLALGPIPYHREHGSDPAGAGRRALREALEHCVATGYSAATVDLGMRGRALCDPVAHQVDYCHFSAKAANALVPLGRIDESLALYRELRRRYTIPQVQMTCAYGIAMLHTRFLTPRDHDQALEWANGGRALAGAEPDPVERAYFEVFADNGIALIEMHRGNLERALELVSAGIARLERELTDDRYVVHRTQLLHNRARVLVALGRLDEAHADFTRLIELDPHYVEYHSDRGALHRRRGELAQSLRDYDRAVEVAVPMAELHFNRASVRAQAGLTRAALADLDYVLELDPAFATAHLTRGSVRLELGDGDGAAADARAGLALTPDDPRLLCLLALGLHSDGAGHEALAAFDRALAIDPEFAPALVNRAVLRCERGELAASDADLTRALELLGDDADVLYNRGFVRQQEGRLDAALHDYNRALKLPGADRAELLCRRRECRAALSAVRPAA
jgi:tetratricopeptide (TPR) repeat protein